jgi:hypothetical protein
MQKLAAARLEATLAAGKQKQPKALANAAKIKKTKLRPPSAAARQRGKSRVAS